MCFEIVQPLFSTEMDASAIFLFKIFDREIHLVGSFRENVDLKASSDLVNDLADSLEQCCS